MAVLDSATNRPMKTPDAPRFAHRQDQHRHQHRRGAGDLQRPAEQHGLPDAADFAERELEADGKEQQHDAEIGEDVDVLLRPTMPMPVGPAIAPAMMNETIGGIRSLARTRIRPSAIA